MNIQIFLILKNIQYLQNMNIQILLILKNIHKYSKKIGIWRNKADEIKVEEERRYLVRCGQAD